MCVYSNTIKMNLPPRDARGRFMRQTISPAGFAATPDDVLDTVGRMSLGELAASASLPRTPNRDIVRQLAFTRAASTPSTSYLATQRLNTLYGSRSVMDDPGTIDALADTVESTDPAIIRQWLGSLPLRKRKEFVSTFGNVLAGSAQDAMELFQDSQTESYRRVSKLPTGIPRSSGPLQ